MYLNLELNTLKNVQKRRYDYSGLNVTHNMYILFPRGSQRKETREPPNILIYIEEPKC